MTTIEQSARHSRRSISPIPGMLLFLATAMLIAGLPMTGVFAQNAINIAEVTFSDGWDPFTFRGLESYRLLSLYSAPMCELNAKQQPENRLAERVIEGGDSWTIRLLPNLYFADGRLCPQSDPGYEPVTARDVEATYRAFIDPRTEVGDPSIRELLKANVRDVKAVDDRTVKVDFKPGVKKSLRYASLEFPVVPAKLLTNGFVTRRKDAASGAESRIVRNPYGAGYFFIQGNSKENKRMELSRNDKLPAPEAAKIAKVTVTYNNPEILINNILGTNWDTPICMPDVPVGKVAILSTSLAHQLISLTMNRYNYIAFNCARPLLKDIRVRRALSCAINREKLRSSYADLCDVITGPFPSDSPNLCDTCRPRFQGYNVELAGQLLEEAGWKRQASGRRANAAGEPLTLTLLTFSEGNQLAATVANRIKSFWEDIGVTVTFVGLTIQDFDQRVYVDKNFDAAFAQWSFFFAPNLTSMFSRNGATNFIGFSDPELEVLLDSIPKLDTDEKTPLYHRIHMKIANDAPYAFLYSVRRYALLDKTIEVGPNLDPFNFFRRVNNWSLK